MKNILMILIVVLIVSACASERRTHLQKILVETPYVEETECLMTTEKHAYVVHPPATVFVERTKNTMNVRCAAPGGFIKNIDIEPKRISSIRSNLGNLGLGIPYDEASGVLYQYPDTLQIYFEEDSDTHVIGTAIKTETFYTPMMIGGVSRRVDNDTQERPTLVRPEGVERFSAFPRKSKEDLSHAPLDVPDYTPAPLQPQAYYPNAPIAPVAPSEPLEPARVAPFEQPPRLHTVIIDHNGPDRVPGMDLYRFR